MVTATEVANFIKQNLKLITLVKSGKLRKAD